MTYELNAAIEAAKGRIPAHLDADEIIANSLANCADVPEGEVLGCFIAAVDMYIDQNCSCF